MTDSELPTRWCRFCHRETKQWIDAVNAHIRVCIECWRRQGDGERIEIADGNRMSGPRRESKPPSVPPPPPVPDEYALRTELNDLRRRLEELEQQVANDVTQSERNGSHVQGSNGSR